jgi:predicted AAA+ superfamily ATPase
MLRGAPEIPANVRLTGLRGVGKTVLLTEFAKIAQQDGWPPSKLN